MKFKITSLVTWKGTIERGHYAAISIALMFIKYNLDRVIAGFVFHRSWYLWNYFVPGDALAANQIPREDWRFYFTLAVIAAPFAWMGVCLTIQRLRSAGLSPCLVIFFFLPLINLLFFLVLCFVPSRTEIEPSSDSFGILLRRLLPNHPIGSAAVSLLLVTPISVLLVKFGVEILGRYGWGLFIGIPFVLGFCSVLFYGVHQPRSLGSCLLVALASVLLAGVVLLAVAIEGAICLLMALPIAGPAALAGGAVAYGLQRSAWSRRPPGFMCSLLPLAVPLLMTLENAESEPAGLLQVSTTVVIDAPPEKVWPRVIAFSEIPAPTEWLFKTGIAYPTHAEIHGHGVGAIRHCVFSTGAFVEPISVWDEPRVLAFSVIQQPPPMQELSPYRGIQPPHLDNYLVSERGELRLENLADGRTLLRGTTWYHHAIWPTQYWQIWSDYLIHHIHLRVLNHIKTLAEKSSDSS